MKNHWNASMRKKWVGQICEALLLGSHRQCALPVLWLLSPPPDAMLGLPLAYPHFALVCRLKNLPTGNSMSTVCPTMMPSSNAVCCLCTLTDAALFPLPSLPGLVPSVCPYRPCRPSKKLCTSVHFSLFEEWSGFSKI